MRHLLGHCLREGPSHSYFLRAWWISSVPGVCIMLTVVAVNLVGDALRDELDPRLRALANL